MARTPDTQLDLCERPLRFVKPTRGGHLPSRSLLPARSLPPSSRSFRLHHNSTTRLCRTKRSRSRITRQTYIDGSLQISARLVAAADFARPARVCVSKPLHLLRSLSIPRPRPRLHPAMPTSFAMVARLSCDLLACERLIRSRENRRWFVDGRLARLLGSTIEDPSR